jgi:hypothetical protein
MMTANKELFYWSTDKAWYIFDEKVGKYKLTDKAPSRAKKSFKMLQEHKRNYS